MKVLLETRSGHIHVDSCYGKIPETEGKGEYLRCGKVAGDPELGDIGRVEQTSETVIWNGECWIGKDAQKVGE